MRAVYMIALATFTGPATALTPLPACVWDTATQRLGDGSSAPGTYAHSQSPADGFASTVVEGYEAYEYGPSAFVLQHCPTGQELLVILPEGNTDRFLEIYDEMVFGEQAYTMRQIGEQMGQMGAGVRMTESEFGDCACFYLYGNDY